MKTAADVMVAPVLVDPSTSLRDLAGQLEASDHEGACVMSHGRLVGVVTQMDLIYQETTLHLPTALLILDGVTDTERSRAQRELTRIEATRVQDLMTTGPVIVAPDATLEHCANLMVRQHLSLLPVIYSDEALLGVVTKEAMIRAAGLLSSSD